MGVIALAIALLLWSVVTAQLNHKLENTESNNILFSLVQIQHRGDRHEILRRRCRRRLRKKYYVVRKMYVVIHAFNPKCNYFERKQVLNLSLLVKMVLNSRNYWNLSKKDLNCTKCSSKVIFQNLYMSRFTHFLCVKFLICEILSA